MRSAGRTDFLVLLLHAGAELFADNAVWSDCCKGDQARTAARSYCRPRIKGAVCHDPELDQRFLSNYLTKSSSSVISRASDSHRRSTSKRSAFSAVSTVLLAKRRAFRRPLVVFNLLLAFHRFPPAAGQRAAFAC
jgi:hypothetical protein